MDYWFERGFMGKCAEYGIDPYTAGVLYKRAAPGDWQATMGRSGVTQFNKNRASRAKYIDSNTGWKQPSSAPQWAVDMANARGAMYGYKGYTPPKPGVQPASSAVAPAPQPQQTAPAPQPAPAAQPRQPATPAAPAPAPSPAARPTPTPAPAPAATANQPAPQSSNDYSSVDAYFRNHESDLNRMGQQWNSGPTESGVYQATPSAPASQPAPAPASASQPTPAPAPQGRNPASPAPRPATGGDRLKALQGMGGRFANATQSHIDRWDKMSDRQRYDMVMKYRKKGNNDALNALRNISSQEQKDGINRIIAEERAKRRKAVNGGMNAFNDDAIRAETLVRERAADRAAASDGRTTSDQLMSNTAWKRRQYEESMMGGDRGYTTVEDMKGEKPVYDPRYGNKSYGEGLYDYYDDGTSPTVRAVARGGGVMEVPREQYAGLVRSGLLRRTQTLQERDAAREKRKAEVDSMFGRV